MNEYSTFLLLDAAMMVEINAKPWTKVKRRSSWLVPLYDRPAWSVSPVLVDIEAARRANRIELVTDFANQIKPQLHASFIDTYLSASGLAEHLRQFTYFIDSRGSEFTLRIADCVVLPWLQRVMTASQWAAIHKPILRWRVHGRDGRLQSLPGPNESHPSTPPLKLTKQQLDSLDEFHGPDQLMTNLRAMRLDHKWAETPQVEIQLAEEVLRTWKECGQSDPATLLLYARGVFDTKGKLLRFPSLRQILEQRDITLVRKDIQNIVASEMPGAICTQY
jgi:hypothetical protein